ncbi:restriction endonuclease subunit S [Enterobacter hormaechei]|uniref:restriction endonuclease subunit S n=1 Tax=Enterobacter hormaechei TaxID=158836 RepID=UPI000BA13E2A|nr:MULTISPECIES: restriction endonuclease subunit S [Enterobacteriaceae]MBT1723789.1 restriction endonuclease subunit S [Enterobacter hormaechei subsp. hoffmannii]EJB8470175.1 restriction endonuclease subunit S [Citrobacter freundii]EJB8558111.1 restriction endonuclease subunit S [Citrobacter freundii]EKU7610371.1 restriction endonuclease subunit S [Citrobacter freundii]MBA8034797.1 restriction endonuclease subunit S [Citrobacter freundii]
MTVEKLITDHIDIWSSALQTRSTAGRGSNGKIDLYGIKKLRELILELAVRGKLVPQDPNDEPASELLKRIAAEKAELVKQGKIKKQKPLPEISEDEKPLELPEGWDYSRLGELFNIVYGKSLSNSDLVDSGYEVFGANGIIGFYSSYLYETEQLLVSCRGAYSGKPNVSPKYCFVTSNSLVLENSWKYLCQAYCFHALTIADKNKIVTGSAQPQVTTTNLEPFIIAIPPLKEQLRISNKVNELMSLCDQLEQQSLSSLDAHQQLVETLLATLTDSLNAEELAENWARVSQYFDMLFSTEASIDTLKQTILQLAVMGKLVQQDPNDEPASELLKRIEQEKAQLMKEGKIKKQKPLPPVSDEEKPFELPEGWECCRFGSLFKSFTNGLYKQEKFYTDKGIISLRMYNIQDGTIDFNGIRRVEVNEIELEQYKLEEGDLLINRVNSKELVGKTAIVPRFHEPLLFESMNIRAKPINKQIDARYLNLFMQSAYVKEMLLSYAKEAIGQASINQQQISNIVLPLPPVCEQRKIIEITNNLLVLISTLKSHLQSAQQTQLHLADALTDAALN